MSLGAGQRGAGDARTLRMIRRTLRRRGQGGEKEKERKGKRRVSLGQVAGPEEGRRETYAASESKASSMRGSGSHVVISHIASGPPASSTLRGRAARVSSLARARARRSRRNRLAGHAHEQRQGVPGPPVRQAHARSLLGRKPLVQAGVARRGICVCSALALISSAAAAATTTPRAPSVEVDRLRRGLLHGGAGGEACGAEDVQAAHESVERDLERRRLPIRAAVLVLVERRGRRRGILL